MALSTRPLSGHIAWPITLIAGGPDCGKSVAAYKASNSDLIHRSFLLAYGEDIHEDYLPIAPRLEVVELDGSMQGFMAALREIIALPPGPDGKPNLPIIDGGNRIWEALSAQAQYAARVRVARKAQGARRGQRVNVPERPDIAEDASDIGRDLWNAATDRWYDVIDLLREHNGPSIMTTILKEISGTDGRGQPTREKEWIIEGQKRLRSDVQVMVSIPRYREFYITRVKSLNFEPTGNLGDAFIPQNRWNDDAAGEFTIDALWKKLGLGPEAVPLSHNFVERESGQQGDVYSGEDVKAEINARLTAAQRQGQMAGTGYNPIAVVLEMIEEVGKATLDSITVQTNEGPMNAVIYLEKLRAHYRAQGCPDPQHAQEQQNARTPETNGAQEPARTEPVSDAQPARAPERASEPAAHAQGAPDYDDMHPAQRAENDYQAAHAAQVKARADAPKSLLRTFLMSELEGQASVLGTTPHALIAHLLDGGKTVDDIDEVVLCAVALKNRPAVVEALHAQGRVSEAAAYALVGPSTFQLWEVLTGTAGVDAPAQEREAAHV